jgi:hypothetical protein
MAGVPTSTVGAFNKTLKDFLEELVECCGDAPGVDKVSLFLAGFDALEALTPRAAMDGFMATMGPHAAMLHAKDPALFDVAVMPGGVDLKGAWDIMSEGTRAAVWQYLQMLYLLASTASAIPPDMLTAIEDVASKYAGGIQNGQFDMASAANMLMSMDISKLLGGGGGDLLGGPPSKK